MRAEPLIVYNATPASPVETPLTEARVEKMRGRSVRRGTEGSATGTLYHPYHHHHHHLHPTCPTHPRLQPQPIPLLLLPLPLRLAKPSPPRLKRVSPLPAREAQAAKPRRSGQRTRQTISSSADASSIYRSAEIMHTTRHSNVSR